MLFFSLLGGSYLLFIKMLSVLTCKRFLNWFNELISKYFKIYVLMWYTINRYKPHKQKLLGNFIFKSVMESEDKNVWESSVRTTYCYAKVWEGKYVTKHLIGHWR